MYNIYIYILGPNDLKYMILYVVYYYSYLQYQVTNMNLTLLAAPLPKSRSGLSPSMYGGPHVLLELGCDLSHLDHSGSGSVCRYYLSIATS